MCVSGTQLHEPSPAASQVCLDGKLEGRVEQRLEHKALQCGTWASQALAFAAKPLTPRQDLSPEMPSPSIPASTAQPKLFSDSEMQI